MVPMLLCASPVYVIPANIPAPHRLAPVMPAGATLSMDARRSSRADVLKTAASAMAANFWFGGSSRRASAAPAPKNPKLSGYPGVDPKDPKGVKKNPKAVAPKTPADYQALQEAANSKRAQVLAQRSQP